MTSARTAVLLAALSPSAARWVGAAAIGAALLFAGCKAPATAPSKGASTTAAPAASARPAGLESPRDDSAAPPSAPKESPSKAEAEAQPHPRVERLETPDGVVTVTTAAKATPEDLWVPVFEGAREKESGVWRMKPPQGDEWLLAIGEFTSTASLDRLEEFYRKALGQPEVRRGQSNGRTFVVVSRLQGSEAIVVRLTGGGAGKPATILVRRAVEGAPVTLEPGGPEPPAPERRGPSVLASPR